MNLYYLFPLLSSLLYVCGILFIKQCSAFGVGVWRTSFVSNIATAILFLPVLAFGGEWRPLTEFWQPAVVALLFIGGQAFTFIALQRGDVSVATPVMGLKTVIVALLVSVVIGETVTTRLWASAGLSAAGIALLNFTSRGRHHDVLSTVLLSGLAATSFSLFDVLVQKFSPAWGIGRFLPVMFLWVSIFSLVFIPFFNAPLKDISKPARPPLLWGAFFLGLQGLLLICTLGYFGNATAVNVIYSSRGLWSVIAVWLVGHWFANTEKERGMSVFRWRLAGAVLMLAAILLTLI